MKVQRVPAREWGHFSKLAHRAVFGHNMPDDQERIDYALLIGTEGELYGFVTCKELDSESLYFQYGGAFEEARGTIKSPLAFDQYIQWVKDAGYKRVSFRVENTNYPMIKLGMRAGFVTCGVRFFKGSVLLEQVLEFDLGAG